MMKRFVCFIVVLTLLALVGMSLAGCNTVRGAGKDIQRGGQAIEDAADRVQNSR